MTAVLWHRISSPPPLSISDCATISLPPHVVDGEADGEAVEAQFALRPPVLLHQRHDHGALLLVVILIRVRQADHVLRVVRERACRGGGYSEAVRVRQADHVLRVVRERASRRGRVVSSRLRSGTQIQDQDVTS